jgi:glycosyltransferase involved in cell wall biosynthesis
VSIYVRSLLVNLRATSIFLLPETWSGDMNSRSDLRPTCPRVLIAAEHASLKFGGEAALPLHYYRVLRRRGEDVRLLVHGRTRDELSQAFPGDDRINYVDDNAIDRLLHRLGQLLPPRLGWITIGFLMRIHTQLAQRRRIKMFVRAGAIDLVHQPIPVSPREPSLLFGLGVPVIMGPMNGGMSFPPAFRRMENSAVRLLMQAARLSSGLLNWLLPGKRHAAALIVSNERTEAALPCPARRVVHLVENGVDFSVWRDDGAMAPHDEYVRFVFMGRLVDWKGVDVLLGAFAQASQRAPMSLTILGDGEERTKLEVLARNLGILAETAGPGRVWFGGWQTQAACARFLAVSDALVLPSLFECGGAVVLEAMAMGKPVLATRWGGPADYLDDTCGLLVDPVSVAAFSDGLEAGLVRLASSQELRERLGAAGRAKAQQQFDWEAKVNQMTALYCDSVICSELR